MVLRCKWSWACLCAQHSMNSCSRFRSSMPVRWSCWMISGEGMRMQCEEKNCHSWLFCPVFCHSGHLSSKEPILKKSILRYAFKNCTCFKQPLFLLLDGKDWALLHAQCTWTIHMCSDSFSVHHWYKYIIHVCAWYTCILCVFAGKHSSSMCTCISVSIYLFVCDGIMCKWAKLKVCCKEHFVCCE